MTAIAFEVLPGFRQCVCLKPLVTDQLSTSSPVIHFPQTDQVTEAFPPLREPRSYTDGHQQIWDISFSDISGPACVLWYSLTPYFSSYTFCCRAFIASFLGPLVRNKHFRLLVQIQPSSAPRHSLGSAALRGAAGFWLRADAGEMLCMNTANVNLGLVGVHLCRLRAKFPFLLLLWGEFSTSQLLMLFLRKRGMLSVDIYLCTYTSVCICINICYRSFGFFWG